ncbi:hypothetical protein R1sor_026029 [Riccia sorocarpa]|uniref:GH18 domain-containing protein n=1 Tax=Riccia sorocarpa TaxID=122646 RepID=A0ABD3GBS6_9MARC
MAWKIIFTVLGLLVTGAAARCSPGSSQKITAPTLNLTPCNVTDPTCDWHGYLNGPDTVILDVNVGPGRGLDPSWVDLIKQIRDQKKAGSSTITTILGGVGIGWALQGLGRAFFEVDVPHAKADIDKWNSWYKVDGIYFEQVWPFNCSTASDMATLVKYVRDHSKSPTGQRVTIFELGQNGPECYLKTTPSADAFVTFQGEYSDYQSYVPASYMKKYSAARWYHQIGEVDPSKLTSVVRKSKANRAGQVFVTDLHFTYPHDAFGPLPGGNTTYWQNEVKQVASSCMY